MFKITAAFCLVWATLSLIILASREGVGWDLTMQIPETAAILTTFNSFPSAVNQHGETPSFGCGHWQRSGQVRKRSLLRALRRAYVHGHAWYRGQQYTFAKRAHHIYITNRHSQTHCETTTFIKNTYRHIDFDT